MFLRGALRLHRNKFIVVRFDGARKDCFVICKVSAVFIRKESTLMRLIELVRNFILRLGLIGGNLFILALRTQGVYSLLIILHKASILRRKIDQWLRKTLAALESFINLANLKLEFISEDRIGDIVGILIHKFAGISLVENIKFENEYSVAGLPSGNMFDLDNATLGRIASVVDGDFIGIELPSFSEGTFLLFGVNLDTIRHGVKTVRNKTQSLAKQMSNRPIRGSRNLEKVLKCRFKIALTSGLIFAGNSMDKQALTQDIRGLSYKLLQIPKFVFSEHIREGKTKEKIIHGTILDLLLNAKFDLCVESEIKYIMYFVSLILLSIFLIRRRLSTVPCLDIYEHATRGIIDIGWQLQCGERAAPFRINIEDIRRHILILGKTGTGKSRLARIIINEIIQRKLSNVWIFDFHKEYLDLATKYNFQVYEPGAAARPLQINIFDSQYEERESYSSFLTAVLLETIKMRGEEVTAQMERAISYATWMTVNSQNPSPLVFLRNLFEWCKEAEETLPSAIYTFYAVTNRLKPFFSGVSKNIFWVERNNIDIVDLANRNVIFDLSYLFKRNLKNEIFLLVNILLRYIVMAMFRRENLLPEETPPKLVLLIEEGRYLVPWRKISTTMSTTAVEDFATLARKYGLGLIVVAQSPYLISQDIVSNSGTLFLMNTEIPEKEHPIVENEELRRYIQMMPPRQAIVKLSTQPSLIHVEIKTCMVDKIESISIPHPQAAPAIPIDFEEYIKSLVALNH